tara:strand:+ start:838 stop:1308 length:471 start_codon:yes stop_codon:yes gene_type:complete
MIPKIYKEYFYQLIKHLNDDHNIKVVQKPGVDDAWYPMLNLIYIDQNLKYRERLFSLLHESGHALIDNQIRQKDILCFNKNTPHKIKSKKGFVHTLNEEILAWNYGKELAKKMEFKLESNKLEDYMSDCIMSYVRLGLKSIYGSEINADIIWTTYV